MSSCMKKKKTEIEMFYLQNSSWARFYFNDRDQTIFNRNDKIEPEIRFDGYVSTDRFLELRAFL